MTITAIRPATQAETELFLFEAVTTDVLIGRVPEGTGPVARTCNCSGTCGVTLCGGSCCSHTASGHTVLER